MLKKLMKHEFRATGRLMLPVYLAVLVLSVFANISIRILDYSEELIPFTLAALILVAFVLALAAAAAMSFILMIQRFYKNLLTDEGYLMCTLPVSMHKIIWSKLLVSTVWYVVTALVSLLSLFVVAFYSELAADFFRWLQLLFRDFFGYLGFNSLLLTAEIIAMTLLGAFFLCLLCYAAMAMGQSFSNHKLLLSVVFYFVFTIVLEILGTVAMSCFIAFSYTRLFNSIVLSLRPEGLLYASLGLVILVEALLCAAFYFLTHNRMTRRLNLQ